MLTTDDQHAIYVPAAGSATYSTLLNFLSQRFAVTANDVIAAINNEDPHDQLKIAYHLILDNRNIVETGKQCLLIDINSHFYIVRLIWTFLQRASNARRCSRLSRFILVVMVHS